MHIESIYDIKLLDISFLRKQLANKELGIKLYHFLEFEKVNELFKRFIERMFVGITRKPTINLCCNDKEIEEMIRDMVHFKTITQFSELTERDIYLVLVYFFYIDHNDILWKSNILTTDFLQQHLSNKELGMRFYETHFENIRSFNQAESIFRIFINTIVDEKKKKIQNANNLRRPGESYNKTMRRISIIKEIPKMRICCTLEERTQMMILTNYIKLLPKYETLTTREIYIILVYIYYSLKYGEQTDDYLNFKFLLRNVSDRDLSNPDYLSPAELMKRKLVIDLYIQLTTNDLILDHPNIIDGNLSGMVRRIAIFNDIRPVAETVLEPGSTRPITLNLEFKPPKKDIPMDDDSPLDSPFDSPPPRTRLPPPPPQEFRPTFFLSTKNPFSRIGGKINKRKNKKALTKKRKV